MKTRSLYFIIIFSMLIPIAFSCNSSCPSSVSPASNLSSSVAAVTGGGWYQPVTTSTWQLQLLGKVNTGYAVDVYDVDLFDISTSEIAAMHASGKKVICYFSAGSYENWRSDASSFQTSDIGKPLAGWAGENWLDIRSQNVYDIMLSRMDLAVSKGCDGVDPDNMDGYTQDSCFPLSIDDQLSYNRNLANAAHTRALSVGLKNDPAQMNQLVSYFDFSISEQCYAFSECSLYQPMTAAGKPVFNVEYDSAYVNDVTQRNNLCSQSNAESIQTLVLPLNLDDSFRYSCF